MHYHLHQFHCPILAADKQIAPGATMKLHEQAWASLVSENLTLALARQK